MVDPLSAFEAPTCDEPVLTPNAQALPAQIEDLTERVHDMEWLFNVVQSLGGASGGQRLIEGLLRAGTRHLASAFGALWVSDKHLCVEHVHESECGPAMHQAWLATRGQLMAWAQRHRRPLVINGAGRSRNSIPRCKILCVPVAVGHGRPCGLIAFFNPPRAADYRSRHVFLCQHLGRQSANLVEEHLDGLSGLHTRAGIEQLYAQLPEQSHHLVRSMLYIDVDQMHVINELFGFEFGNEVLVRVGELLGPPHLPKEALVAHLTSDRFAVVLPQSDTKEAVAVAERLQRAMASLSIGPADEAVEISASCGVAALLPMPHGLARALAAAELACKTAKKQGRSRIKVDTCDDGTMLRNHVDAVAVGHLRAALKSDGLYLFAQRIVPLQDPALPGGYEILLRLRDPTDGLVTPGAMIHVAQRYQLLPSLDRWVIRRVLRVFALYRDALEISRLSMSINLSGQSICDQAFTDQLAEELQAAALPPGSVMFEITEQAAVTNLERADQLIRRLGEWKCRFALDDFGTGSNSLTYLNSLPISRIKIDGSFVRDILTNPRAQATVRGVVDLARGMSVETVAEYVESAAIAERVRELGVDYGQGYTFGKPEPLDAVLEKLACHQSARR